jgi:hypothetical protein
LTLIVFTCACEIVVNTTDKNIPFAIDSIVLLADVLVLKIIEHLFEIPKKSIQRMRLKNDSSYSCALIH